MIKLSVSARVITKLLQGGFKAAPAAARAVAPAAAKAQAATSKVAPRGLPQHWPGEQTSRGVPAAPHVPGPAKGFAPASDHAVSLPRRVNPATSAVNGPSPSGTYRGGLPPRPATGGHSNLLTYGALGAGTAAAGAGLGYLGNKMLPSSDPASKRARPPARRPQPVTTPDALFGVAPTENPMTKLQSDNSQDAFRLGCYAAAKHAGASHDEAVSFVAGLDHQANQQSAFRLGVYKTAKDHGATDAQAAEFVQYTEKQAGGAQVVGGLIAKGLGGFARGAGNLVSGVGRGMLQGAPTRALGAAENKGIKGILKLKPGIQKLPRGSPVGTKPLRLTRAAIKAQQLAHLQGLRDKGFAVGNLRKGVVGAAPALNTGAGGKAVNWMEDNAGLTGAGVLGGGYWGAKKLMGDATPPPAPAAATQGQGGGNRMSQQQLQQVLQALMQGQGY